MLKTTRSVEKKTNRVTIGMNRLTTADEPMGPSAKVTRTVTEEPNGTVVTRTVTSTVRETSTGKREGTLGGRLSETSSKIAST